MRLHDGAIYIVARIVPSALGFATATWLTWILAPDAYGLYGLGMAAVLLGSNVLFDWLPLSMMRWYQTHGQDQVFRSTVRTIFASICVSSVVLLGIATALGITHGHAGEAWLFLVGTWAYAWFEFSSQFQIARFKPWRYLAMNVTRNGAILAGSVVIASRTHAAEPVLAVCFVAMAVSGCLFSVGWPSCRRPTFDWRLARSLIAFGAPMGLTMVLFGLTTSINRVMLGALSTKAAVGAFTIAFTLVQNSLGVIATGIGAASYSAVVRAVESGDAAAARAHLRRSFSMLLGLLLPSGVGLAMLAPKMAALMVSPTYFEAVTSSTPWLAATAILMGLRANYVDFAFHLAKRPALLAQVMGVSAAVNIVLGFALIPRFAYLGACAAMFFAFAFAFIHASLLARSAFPLPFPRGETARIALATAAMAAALTLARSWPGIAGLVSAVAVGSCVYVALAVTLNVLGMRDAMRERWDTLRVSSA